MKNILKNHKYILIFCFVFLAACTTNTQFKSRDYNAKGEMYLKTEKYAKAEKYLNKAIEANPYNLDAYKNRGTLYYARGDYEKALSDFDHVLSYEKHNANVLAAKGAALANMGKYTDAYNTLYTSLKLNPSNVAALNSMAGLLFMANDFEKAKQIYTVSLEYNTTPEAYLMRAKCYEQLGQTAEAEHDYALAKLLKLGVGNTAPEEKDIASSKNNTENK
ncbi:MAG: tetratricopeptide repeat protein [Elusimicrobiaceae bacterium]|nr:tetratricopeptide repeat protein [Elusimicrobiaceae bacterium]